MGKMIIKNYKQKLRVKIDLIEVISKLFSQNGLSFENWIFMAKMGFHELNELSICVSC